jgi:probable HAF family extracellular repeat protein
MARISQGRRTIATLRPEGRAVSDEAILAPLTEATAFTIECANPVFGAVTSSVVVTVVVPKFKVIELPMSRATALNDAGDVAGQRPNSYTFDAVAWIAGAIVDVRVCKDLPYCYRSYTPWAINSERTVVGLFHPSTGNYYYSFVWHYGDDSDPGQDNFNTPFVGLHDINDAGQIVGTGGISGPAVLITGETVVRLADVGSAAYAINAAGHITGNVATGGFCGRHLFLYIDGVMQDLGTLGGSSCYPTAINAADAIVGWEDGLPGTRAFRYADSRFTDLGSLGGAAGRAYGIIDAGQIVGFSTLAGADPQAQRAFLYVNERMHDLNDLVEPLPIPLTEARKINNRGQIIANACPSPGTTGVCRAYLLTPLSLP